jgi:hypothetical protein
MALWLVDLTAPSGWEWGVHIRLFGFDYYYIVAR